MMRRALLVVATLLSLAAGPWHPATPAWSDERPRQPMPGDSVLSGTVSCRTCVTLPGMATVRVELIDLSAKDARSAIIGADSFWITGGKLPVGFRISYDPVRIDPAHVYVVRARIMDGDKVLLQSTVSYHVLTRGALRTVDLLVVPAQSNVR
jgi:putative lipoprotein